MPPAALFLCLTENAPRQVTQLGVLSLQTRRVKFAHLTCLVCCHEVLLYFSVEPKCQTYLVPYVLNVYLEM